MDSFQSLPDLPPPSLGVQIDSTLDALAFYTAAMDVQRPGQDAIALFERLPRLPGIVLWRGRALVGILPRHRFFECLSRPYGREVFSHRSLGIVEKSMDLSTVVMPANTPITQAVQWALNRPSELLYDPLLVQLRPGDYRLVDSHDLLVAQAEIHQLAVNALQGSQQALQTERDLARTTLRSIGDGVVTTSAEGKIESLNQVAEDLLGCPSHQVQGQPLAAIFANMIDTVDNGALSLAGLSPTEHQRLALESSLTTSTCVLITPQGQERTVNYSVAPIQDDQGRYHGAVWVLRDITQQRQLTSKIRWQASHDSLTGLINRMEFERLLEQANTMQSPEGGHHTLCYLDLDRFKIVNDTCGHLAGDELLRQVSDMFQQQVRSVDVVARLGGDEFGILLYGCSLTQGQKVAESLRQAVYQFRFHWQQYNFAIGVSIGLTAVDGYSSVDDLLRQSDSACYWAKHSGRNQICLYQDIETNLDTGLGGTWVSRLTRALEQGSFCLDRQVVLSADSPAVPLYHELLLRLQDETGQIHPPGAFLSTAERYNLMPDIDRWVIHHTLTHYHQLCDPLPIAEGESAPCLAINLSGASLSDTHLVERIQTALVEGNVPPSQICFELNETAAITNLTRTRTITADLKQLGCRLALDDFGGGPSSFAYLQELPIDYLKIDGNLIQSVTTDPVTRAMVESIHRVAQVMGIRTIAEQVDNPDAHHWLQSMGVNYVQGYLFEAPQTFSPALPRIEEENQG